MCVYYLSIFYTTPYVFKKQSTLFCGTVLFGIYKYSLLTQATSSVSATLRTLEPEQAESGQRLKMTSNMPHSLSMSQWAQQLYEYLYCVIYHLCMPLNSPINLEQQFTYLRWYSVAGFRSRSVISVASPLSKKITFTTYNVTYLLKPHL